MFNIYNVIAYQAVWIACVEGATHGVPWIGAASAGAAIVVHFALVDEWQLDLRLIALAAVLGFVVDSSLAAAGLLEFTSGVWVAGLTTYWMLSLWLVFATTLRHSLRWLTVRPWAAAAAGAIGGPLAYYAGARLGALRIPSLTLALLAIGLLWGAALWALAVAAGRFALRDALSTPASEQRA